MAFCNKCGSEVGEGLNFCSKCGNALTNSSPLQGQSAGADDMAVQQLVAPVKQWITSNVVWLLACVQLFGAVGWVLDNVRLGFVIVMGLTVTFVVYDLKQLKAKNVVRNSTAWLVLGVLLTPVYLFVRAAKTDKKYGPAITNIIILVLYLVVVVGTAGQGSSFDMYSPYSPHFPYR